MSSKDFSKAGRSLRVGTAETDITPLLGVSLAGHFADRKASEVESPLKSKAVVLDNGETIVAIVALDLISIAAGEVEKIRQLASQTTGLSPDNILIACTHTHTGPATRSSHAVQRDEEYCQWLVRRVADSIQLAWGRRQPARLAWGQGEQHDLIFCRRYRMLDGTIVTNPGRGNPEVVEPAGPVDPMVGVLYIESEEGSPLAVIGRYSLHYVGTNSSDAISSDYYGEFARAIRRQLGEECAVLLLNGNSAQINNVNVFDTNQPTGNRQARIVARALAGEVLKVLGRLRPVSEVSLGATRETIHLARKTITANDLKVAHKILNTPDGEETQAPFDWLVGAPLPPRLHRFYARGVQRVSEMPQSFTSEVQCLRIADSAWIGMPGEIFVEIGETIRASSPARETFVVGLANDSLGYFPTDQAFEEGGYETWATGGSPIGPSEGILIRHSLNCIHRLFPEPGKSATSIESKNDE